MVRNIRITEEQYKMLQEATEDVFAYLSDNNTHPNDGQVHITADGKPEPTANGIPHTSDYIQKQLTPQGYNRYRLYGNITNPIFSKDEFDDPDITDYFDDTENYEDFREIYEGVSQKEDDKNRDGVSDSLERVTSFGPDLDRLSNGNKDDDLFKIPEGVQHRINLLMKEIATLNEIQMAMVLNKIIEAIDIDKIPYSWKKALMAKIWNNGAVHAQVMKQGKG